MVFHTFRSRLHERSSRETPRTDFMTGSYRSDLIDVAEKHAAKYRSVRIRILRHHRNLDGKVALRKLLRLAFSKKMSTDNERRRIELR